MSSWQNWRIHHVCSAVYIIWKRRVRSVTSHLDFTESFRMNLKNIKLRDARPKKIVMKN